MFGSSSRSLQFRTLLPLVILFALGCGRANDSLIERDSDRRPVVTLRIGCQKSSLLLNLLRANGSLQARLGPQVDVVFKEFPAGPQLLEALNVGGIDFGHAGETPPVFAQAAGAPLVYTACEEESPGSEAILVPTGSPIRQVADLRGKRVALNKGSNVHYLLVRALEEAGLSYSDVQPVFLPPADARAAFESNSVDAWVIWDPYYSAAERAGNAQVLTDGTGMVSNRGFYLASRSFSTDHSDVLKQVIDELAKTSEWVEQHHEASVNFLAETLGMEVETIDRAERRRRYGISLIQPDVVAYQQRVADSLFRIGLIPRQVNVSEIIWQPSHLTEVPSHGDVLVPADPR
jgi:sulfonate transport system substrate-binding protein